jgi:hypothetical protein
MKLSFPSSEFDDAVAGVCHGSATEAEMRALNELLRGNANARDEYLLRIELHTRLASESALFAHEADAAASCRLPDTRAGSKRSILRLNPPVRARRERVVQVLAVAACLIFIAGGVWALCFKGSATKTGTTSTAVAMLTRIVDAQWRQGTEPPRVGAALEPGTLRLESGLAQVVFYSGARVVMEGPAELQLLSPVEAVCPHGRLLFEVPPPAHGLRLRTPQLNVVDLGTSFGISATAGQSEVHVFKGKVELVSGTVAKRSLQEGQAVVVQGRAQPRLMAASAETFAPLFEFQQRSLASEAFRYEQWQFANAKLNQDPSLLVHLDFGSPGSTEWTLRNAVERNRSVPEATVVGCARAEGRWREKMAVEFQSVNDRVRLAVPGEFNGLTLSAWVCIKGLDRQFNSLFMSDGFDPGTVHWLVRNDGVLGLTVFGPDPGKFQILASPPMLSLDALGIWQHLAVVLDGKGRRVVHYLNGFPVSQHPLKFGPPFRVGSAELGNWNARSGPNPAPALIRNLSGAFDEFELFSRALIDAEVQDLYMKGKPD